MAEAVNGLYKTELIRRRGPWRTVEQVELATLGYVWWWNNQRLHGELDMRPPAEVEADYYAGLDTPLGHPSPKPPDRNETQGESQSAVSLAGREAASSHREPRSHSRSRMPAGQPTM